MFKCNDLIYEAGYVLSCLSSYLEIQSERFDRWIFDMLSMEDIQWVNDLHHVTDVGKLAEQREEEERQALLSEERRVLLEGWIDIDDNVTEEVC